jgi:ketosteroid isomerase-like protein
MSSESVEIVRQAMDAYAAGDIEAMLALIDPDGEIHSAVIGGAEGNAYRGHSGIRTWFAETRESFEELDLELTEYRDLGDRVLGFGRVHARGRESGVELDSATGWVFTFRGGRILRAEGYLDPAKAIEVAGLNR